MTEITDMPEPPNTANGFRESWSVRPSRRSSCSTAADGVVSLGCALATIDMISRNGTTTKNTSRPANTPAMVRRNCFIGHPS